MSDTKTRKKDVDQGLTIDEIIKGAERVEERIKEKLPSCRSLIEVSDAVGRAAERAHIRVERLKSPFSIARIRLYVVIVAFAWLGWWLYSNYIQRGQVRIAVPAADSKLLRDRVQAKGSTYVRFVECSGSREGLEFIRRGRADMTVVQGGVSIGDEYEIVSVVRTEQVLFFRKGELPEEPTVITFNPDQGSHVLAQLFFQHWGYPRVKWVHAWKNLTSEEEPQEVPEAHAVFVVVDPADPGTIRGVRRMAKAGFVLGNSFLGAYEKSLPYLRRQKIQAGYYHLEDPEIPDSNQRDFETYAVENYLVASAGTTDRQRSEALHVLSIRGQENDLASEVFHGAGSSLMGDLANFAEAVVNIVVILAALFGVEIIIHRRYFHDLDRLISRLSLLQSERDLIGVEDRAQANENMHYLGFCSDVLGLISIIAGYYGQENSAFLFNGQTSLLHTRANELKLNIQLKILQGIRNTAKA